MNVRSCSDTIHMLLHSTNPPAAELLVHVRGCDDCRQLVTRAADLESLVSEGAGDEGATEASRLERTERRVVDLVKWKSTVRSLIEIGFAGTIAVGAILWTVVAGTYLYPDFGGSAGTRSELLSGALPTLFVVTVVIGFALGLSIARLRVRTSPVVLPRWARFVAPLLVLVFVAEYRLAQFLVWNHDSWFTLAAALWVLTAAAAGYLPASAGLPYKRLRKGRMLSGVCLGIAERTSVPVGIIRLVFLVLVFARLSGVLLYVVLDLLMRVHPDDRATLLRFRLRRWWNNATARALG